MKLIHCNKCYDVMALRFESRSCYCGESGGRYEPDGLNAVFWGPALPLGFANASFSDALQNQPEAEERWGRRFEAFVIEKDCATFKKEK